MANFEISQRLTAIAEGGYTKNPKDSGNWTGGVIGKGALVGTKYGISAPTYGVYLKRTPTEADMRAMTYATAKAIYKEKYWKPVWGDSIKNQSIANIVYDTAVNSWDEAFRFTRQAIKNQNIKVLGTTVVVNRPYFNNDIIAALNKANQQKIFNDIKTQREADYRQQGGVFLEGWLNRLTKFVYTPEGVVSVTLIILLSLGLVAYMNWSKVEEIVNKIN